MALFLLSLPLLFISGCATAAKYDATIQSWIGENVEQLYLSWGEPSRSSTATDSRKIIEYTQQDNVQTGGYNYTDTIVTMGATTHSGIRSTEVQNQAPVQNVSLWCKTTFIADVSGVITSASSEGNNCKGKPAR